MPMPRKARVHYSPREDCAMLREVVGPRGIFECHGETKQRRWAAIAAALGTTTGLEVHGEGVRKHVGEVVRRVLAQRREGHATGDSRLSPESRDLEALVDEYVRRSKQQSTRAQDKLPSATPVSPAEEFGVRGPSRTIAPKTTQTHTGQYEDTQAEAQRSVHAHSARNGDAPLVASTPTSSFTMTMARANLTVSSLTARDATTSNPRRQAQPPSMPFRKPEPRPMVIPADATPRTPSPVPCAHAVHDPSGFLPFTTTDDRLHHRILDIQEQQINLQREQMRLFRAIASSSEAIAKSLEALTKQRSSTATWAV